jgi:ligand-binding sensor domain-containing protein/two-component sensor histidine kinase
MANQKTITNLSVPMDQTRMMRLTLLLFCCAMLNIALAQPRLYQSDLVFENLGVKEGLSHPTVNCVFKDSRGFLWLGTEDGLNRYDGVNFKIFKHNSHDENSLADNRIYSITEDGNKNLWMGTGNGLSVLNMVNENFTNYYNDPKDPHSIRSDFKLRLFTDKKGDIWVTALSSCIARFNKQINGFDYFELPDKQLSTCIIQDHKNTYYVSSSGSLYSFDPKKGFTKKINLDSVWNRFYNNTFIYEDRNHYIWVGSWGAGIGYIDPVNFKLTQLINEPAPADPGLANIYRCIGETIESNEQNTIWLGSSYGLVKIPIINKQYPTDINQQTSYHHNKDIPFSLINGEIISICNAGKNRLVLGSSTGFCIINPAAQKIGSSINKYGGTVIQLLYDKEIGKIWVSTWYSGDGLFLYDIDKMRIEPVEKIPSKDRITGSVSAVAKEDNNLYWVGSMAGLYLFNYQTRKYTPYLHDPKDSGSISSNRIYCMLKDSKKRLWVGTYGGGLNVAAPGSVKFKNYMPDEKNKRSLPHNLVWVLFEDSRHNIWIGTDAGLARYNESTDDFTVYKKDRRNHKSIIHDQSSAITEDGDGNLWIGSSNGLSKYIYKEDRFEQYTSSDGMIGNNVNALATDNHGNIWITTGSGLSFYDIRKKTFSIYGYKEGVLEPQLLTCIVKDDKGTMYASFGNNMMTFNPDDLMPDTETPRVVITGFRIFNRKVSYDNFIDSLKQINLGFKENFFSFDFVAPDIIKGKSITYAYLLEGADKEWIITDRPEANYTHIDGGKYTFKAKARYSGGEWGPEIAIKIFIKPPFWKTWWFVSSILFIGVLLGYTIHLVRVNKILAVERIRNRVARDLHDDMGSTLSTINILSSMAKAKLNTDRVKTAEYINKISDNSQRMMEAMDDIVWAIKPANDSMQKIIARMREYATSILEAKDIELSFIVADAVYDIKLNMEARRDLFLIFKEAVNNIAKYSHCERTWIQLTMQSNKLQMIVKDDGVGFEVNLADGGNGLGNMKKRADALNGNLSIQSKRAQGTIITLTIPTA